MATVDDILLAAKVGESTDWEFKSARGGFPGGFWETYSAMANAEGGTVVLGVRADDAGVHLDGLTPEQVSRYQKTLWDNLNNRGHVNRNLLERDDVEVLDMRGSSLLVVRIPRASRIQRPVHLGLNPLGGTFRRSHEGDYRCGDDEVRRMLRDADPLPADQRILPHFGIDDLDRPSLTQYRQRFLAAKGDHPWLAMGDQELLDKLGGWRTDRASGASGLTLAGLLMFGKDQAIRDPEVAPAYFVDYREKLDPGTRWSDRIYPDGTWEANLFQFYVRVSPRLMGALPTPFRLEGGMRKDDTPAREALREAFVNTVIHADYSAPGSVVVERHPDRILFGNPGMLLVSLEQYLRGGVSECRNKNLQKMLLMIGGGEQAGSGIDKIRSGWRLQQWRSPMIRVQEHPDRVELTMPLVSLIEPATIDRLRERFGSRLDTLSAAEMRALATAEAEGIVSNRRLQALLLDHPADIGRMLQGLRERGFLLSDNRRRWTTYRLENSPRREGWQASLFEHPVGRGGSSEPSGTFPHRDPDSPHKDLPHKDLPHKDLPHKDPEWGKLQALAAPVARRKRAGPAEVRRTVLLLCQRRYLTAEDLGLLLQRNANGLRDRFLTAMVQEGVLRLRFPASSSNPDQAYTATTTP